MGFYELMLALNLIFVEVGEIEKDMGDDENICFWTWWDE